MRLLRVTVVAAALAAVIAPRALAGAVNSGLPGASSANPLVGVQMGTYKIDSTDPSIDAPSAYFNTARNNADSATFTKLLNVPRFRWFGAWIPTHDRSD